MLNLFVRPTAADVNYKIKSQGARLPPVQARIGGTLSRRQTATRIASVYGSRDFNALV
jgi:hypothetical protein